MRYTSVVVALMVLLATGNTWAQPNVLWQHTYGGDWTDVVCTVVQTADGGYALGGYKTTGQGNDCNIDFWLVRTDANGNEIWAQNYGSAHWDYCYSMIETSDGGFALVGITQPAGGGPNDGLLVKTDSQGNQEWLQTYDFAYDVLSTVAESVNGGFILGGETSAGNSQLLLVRTNANGTMVWSRQFGGFGAAESCQSLLETPNGDIVMAGQTNYHQQGGGLHQYVANALGGFDFWLVKANSNGDFQWDRSYGTQDNEHCAAVIQTSDNGFAMVGSTVTYAGADSYVDLIKVDANGDNPWMQNYDGQYQQAGSTLIETATGGFIIGGGIYPGGNTGIALLMKTDANGGSVWTEAIGNGIQNSAVSVIETADGGYAFAGNRVAQGGGTNSEYWLVKLAAEEPHYSNYTETDDNNTILITAANCNGVPVPTGWEIGVFTPGNVLAGGGVWTDGQQLGFGAFGDDNQTQTVEGFVQSETMNFCLWDNNAGVEYSSLAIVIQGSLQWAVDGATALRLEGYQLHTMNIELAQNWNLISVNVVPPPPYWTGNQGPDIQSMMAQFGQHLVLMKDEHGRFFWPAFNFNNIPFWNLTEGYQVKVDQQVQGSWTGALIPASTTIPVEEGWNMVAYYPTYELSASSAGGFYALSSILNHLLIAKDRAGHFLSPYNNFSNMPRWRESQGYQVKVDADVALSYPTRNDNIQSLPGENLETGSRHWADLKGTGANMSVLVTAVAGLQVQTGDQIAALDADGNVVGVGTIQDGGMCGIAVWGDDVTTDVADGLRKGESFELRIWSSTRNTELALRPDAGQGVPIYETDGLISFTATAETSAPSEFYLRESYPNPFNSTTRISIGMPRVALARVGVYDVAGRQIALLVDGELQAGNHSIVWNADNMPAGLYMIKMQSDGFTAVRKVTLVK